MQEKHVCKLYRSSHSDVKPYKVCNTNAEQQKKAPSLRIRREKTDRYIGKTATEVSRRGLTFLKSKFFVCI